MNAILPSDYKHRLTILETRLAIAISLKDYKTARILITEIQELLQLTNELTKKEKKDKPGKTVLGSVKKVLYNSLCCPESEIYKAWFNNGMKVFLSKEYIGTVIIACLANLEIGIRLLAAPIIALIVKFGIEVFCEKCKPVE